MQRENIERDEERLGGRDRESENALRETERKREKHQEEPR